MCRVNADLFFSLSAGSLIEQHPTLASQADFADKLLGPLDAEFGEGSKVVVWSISDTWIALTCRFSGCKFRCSYSFVQTEGDEIGEITRGKSYFKSHSLKAHLDGAEKAQRT